MTVLLDTHLLIWLSSTSYRLSSDARALLSNPEITLVFSVVSLWEVAIKRGLGRENFQTDPRLLRRGLLDNGYRELPVSGDHAVALDGLPSVHKDPFDRLLVAQARSEGFVLLTADRRLALYGSPVRLV